MLIGVRFTFFYAAVALVAWSVGRRWALTATVLSMVIVVAAFGLWHTPPASTPAVVGRTVAPLTLCVLLTLLISAMRGFVTELKVRNETLSRLAEDLRRSQLMFQRIADASPDVIYIHDIVRDTSVYSNRALSQVLGYREAQVREMDGKLTHSLVHPDDEARAREYLRQISQLPDGQTSEFEYRVTDAHGETRWLRSHNVVFTRDESGAVREMMGVARDVTRDRALLASLERAKESADAANAAKDQFLATLSHELRTPLSAIVAWSQLLQKKNLTSDEVSYALDTIHTSAIVQNSLIQDLLDISRITSGKLQLELRPVAIHQLVRGALDAVRPISRDKDVAVSINIQPIEGTVVGDGVRLQQVLWNLLTNAIKFSPAGSTVSLKVTQDASWLVMAVSDTGCGISAAFLPQVFERFQQGDTHGRHKMGLGLGLSIARELVTRHGGTIVAESPGAGLGATFTVRLPLQPAKPSQAVALRRTGGGPPRLCGLRVLVVDDDEASRRLLKQLLELEQAEVAVAGSAAQAFTALKAAKPDVLLSDIRMPGMDGLEFVRHLRALGPAFVALPMIAITALAGRDEREEALAAGFSDYVVKPFDPEALVGMLARSGALVRK